MDSLTINLAGIADDSIVDGPGIRITLFAQGCPHHCPGCHNPETHKFGTGTQTSIRELFLRIRRNPLVRGITFSGGEPFSQAPALGVLAVLLRSEGYELAAYTGYTIEELLESGDKDQLNFLKQLDVLVDGKFMMSQRNLNLHWRGSENQRILDVQRSVAQHRPIPCTDERWA